MLREKNVRNLIENDGHQVRIVTRDYLAGARYIVVGSRKQQLHTKYGVTKQISSLGNKFIIGNYYNQKLEKTTIGYRNNRQMKHFPSTIAVNGKKTSVVHPIDLFDEKSIWFYKPGTTRKSTKKVSTKLSTPKRNKLKIKSSIVISSTIPTTVEIKTTTCDTTTKSPTTTCKTTTKCPTTVCETTVHCPTTTTNAIPTASPTTNFATWSNIPTTATMSAITTDCPTTKTTATTA